MALEDYDSKRTCIFLDFAKGIPVPCPHCPGPRQHYAYSIYRACDPAISVFGERNCSLLLSGSDVIKVSWFVHLSLYVRA
jgi:hypothetical protein